MMKLKILLVLFLLISLLFSIKNTSVYAQGACSCTGPPSGACTGVSTDNCDAGYVPSCSTAAQCIGNACTCIAQASVSCGAIGQVCCTSGNACSSGLIPLTTGNGCTCVSQTPPITPPPPAPQPSGNGASPLCGSGIRSAIGCIPVLNDAKGTAFSSYVLRWAVGIGGGIAFILIIYASFMVMTSQGNPERLKAGQELLTSAISGLLLLVFSIFLLNLIGVKILGIFQ